MVYRNHQMDGNYEVASNAGLYVGAVVALSIIAVIAVVTIFALRPDKDNASLILLVLGLLTPVIMGFLGAAIQQVHLAVNSRLSQLVALTAKASQAEGQLIGSDQSVVVAAAAKKVLDEAAVAASATLQVAAKAAEQVIQNAIANLPPFNK